MTKHPLTQHALTQHLLSVLAPLSVVIAAAGLALAIGGSAGGCAAEKAPPPPEAESMQPIPVQNFQQVWSTDIELRPGDKLVSVHVREDRVFAYTYRGEMAVMNRADGDLQKVEKIRGGEEGAMRPPVVLKEHVVVPTRSALVVFDKYGRYEKSLALKVAVRSNAVGAGTDVFLGGDARGSGRVAAIDITRDYVPIRWELMVSGRGVRGAPALSPTGDALYIGAGDGNVYAVDPGDREPLWSVGPGGQGFFQTGGPIVGDVWADDAGVYVASTDTKLYVLNPGTGRIRWQYHAGVPLQTGPVATKEMVYQYLPGDGMAAFAKTEPPLPGTKITPVDRRPRWVVDEARQFLAEDERFSYLRGDDGRVLAAEKASGRVAFRSESGFDSFGLNTKGDGVVYVATEDGRVMAIAPVLRPGVVGQKM